MNYERTPAYHSPSNPEEINATSAPLQSAAFALGEYCKGSTDRYMLCKRDSSDPSACLQQGQEVTRCAFDLFKQLDKYCKKEWEEHWQCLDSGDHNHEYQQCRKPERVFNQCLHQYLGLKKRIPGAPPNETPIFMRKKTIYGQSL